MKRKSPTVSEMPEIMHQLAQKSAKRDALDDKIAKLAARKDELTEQTFFYKFDIVQTHMILSRADARIALPRAIMQIVFNFAQPYFSLARDPDAVYVSMLQRDYSRATNTLCDRCNTRVSVPLGVMGGVCACIGPGERWTHITFCGDCGHPCRDVQMMTCTATHVVSARTYKVCSKEICSPCCLIKKDSPLMKYTENLHVGTTRMTIPGASGFVSISMKNGNVYLHRCKEHRAELMEYIS
jgi:hypothetical protein